MPAALLTRDEVIERLTRTFRQFGYDGATLARLETSTGLKRPSLYHHFPGGKEEMARAVLEHADSWLQTHVLEPLATDGAAEDKLRAMCVALTRFYASGKESCLLGVMSFGDARDLFQQPVRLALKRWTRSLASLLIDAGIDPSEATRRAEDSVRDIQGALVMSRGLNSTKPFQRTLAELPRRLLQGNR